MKTATKIFLTIVLLIAPLFFNSCSKTASSKPSLVFYLSVKIMRMENNQMVPHAERSVHVHVTTDGRFILGVTGSDGWLNLAGTYPFSLDDQMYLTIYSKYDQKSVDTPTISPKTHSNFFVTSASDFGTNLPVEGYHFLVIGLD